MFWKKRPVTEKPSKPKDDKLPGPKGIPELVGRHLIVTMKKDPDWVWNLKTVVHKRPEEGKDAFDVRVFDGAQAVQKGVEVKDWTTLDEHPDLILCEGWFDRKSMRVQIEEKKA